MAGNETDRSFVRGTTTIETVASEPPIEIAGFDDKFNTHYVPITLVSISKSRDVSIMNAASCMRGEE